MAFGLLANMYIPSFAQLVTGPLVWSFFVISMVVTVPVVFAVGLIEALVLRRYTSGLRLWTLTWRLAILNTFTSVLGTYFTWPGTNLWPGLALAFVLTVPVEAGLLHLGSFGLPKGFSSLSFLKASATMNAASYAALALALAGLIYLPTLGQDSSALAKATEGRVVIADINGLDTVVLPAGNLITGRGSRRKIFQPWEYILTQTGDLYALGDRQEAARPAGRYTWARGGWRRIRMEFPPEDLIAISPDRQCLLYAAGPVSLIKPVATGPTPRVSLPANLDWGCFSYDNRFLICGKRGSRDTRLVDLKTGKTTPLAEARDDGSFNPARPELAWIAGDKSIVIYDCLTGKRRKLTVPGSIASVSSVAWSPDGKYLAYLGDANPFTRQRFTPDLRVIEVAGGESATVYRGLRTLGGSTRLFWVR